MLNPNHRLGVSHLQMKTIVIACLCSITLAASMFGQSPLPQTTPAAVLSQPTPVTTPFPATSPVISATPVDDLEERIERKIEKKLRRHIDINIDRHGGGDDFPSEIFIVPAIALVFLSPVLIIAVILFFNFWKTRQLHRTVQMMVEKGQEVPAGLFASPLPVARPVRSDKRRGIILVTVGLGIMFFFGAIADGGVWALGIIPFMIGMGYLLVSRMETPKQSSTPPELP